MSKRFAVIEKGIVTNILLAEDIETAEAITGFTCVEDTDRLAYVGLGWDGTEFEQPTDKEVPGSDSEPLGDTPPQ